MTGQKLYRVWLGGRYELRRAESTDELYRSYKPKRRREITRVDEVRKTSEVLNATREENN